MQQPPFLLALAVLVVVSSCVRLVSGAGDGAAALRGHPAVASVHEDVILPLHTTRSPLFLHLPPYDAPDADGASTDVIIGVLDTGVWPESPSFGDVGMGPVPSRWRGSCETNATDFPSSMCNRKLIGARAFFRGYGAGGGGNGSHVSLEFSSPRDHDGHGTHTASTAAGAVVADAGLLGYAEGTARGMAPGARVAAYKVCWRQGCFSSDILAGMEKAIDDGVDVLSLSLGGGAFPLSRDPIAVGALAATRRGIVVACSAGNSGPSLSSLVNTAPWVITVGAGTLDRNFPAYAELGNGETHAGMSLYSGDGLGDEKLPVVYNKGIRAGSNASKLCMEGTLDAAAVKGKVVLCDRGGNARVEKGAGRQAGRRRRDGAGQHRRQRGGARGRQPPSPRGGRRRQERRRHKEVRGVGRRRRGGANLRRHGARRAAGAGGGRVQLAWAEQAGGAAAQAGRDRAGGEHPRRVCLPAGFAGRARRDRQRLLRATRGLGVPAGHLDGQPATVSLVGY